MKRSFHSCKERFQKVFLLIMLLVPTTVLAAHGQIAVKGKSLTLKQVISQIEKNSSYTFFYKSVDLNQAAKQDINCEGNIEEVLETVFKGQPIQYVIKGNEVILKSEENRYVAKATLAVRQQTKTVTVRGTVNDDFGAVIGASVIEKNNTGNGTITDVDGNFTLTVPVNAELVISYIGYITQVIAIKPGVTTYNCTLKEDAKTLAEVVVVGYGTQKKVNLTGSVASVSTDEIKDRVQTNVLSAVQGTVPGVTIISRPGATPSINFRGRGNLGSSSPLYVIDGAISDATFFSNLDPNSIESISFLKDAASASIYGARAAYGVVLVTTKNGKKDRLNVSYSGYIAMKNPTYIPETIDSWDYATLLNEAKYNENPKAGKNQAYTEEEIGWFRDGSKPDYYPNSQWADMILDKNVITTQHSLNFSGGSDKIRYFTGLGYMYDDKFMPGQSSDRYNLTTSIQSDMTKWLTLKAGVKYIRSSSETEHGVPWMGNFLLVPTIMVGRQSNGEWGSIAGGKDATQTFLNSNPLRELSKNNWSKSSTEKSMYDLGFDLKPISGLTISGQGTYNRYEYKSKSYTGLYEPVKHFETGKEISGSGSTEPNRMDKHWETSSTLLTTLTAKYDWSKGVHDVNVLVGTSYEHYQYERFYAQRKDFISDALPDFEQGATLSKNLPNGAGMAESKMNSYFGRINYNLMDRYLLEVNIRADASSRFHKDNRWGWFPSFSAGWRISEEGFMKDIPWINNMKIRASYGSLGNINNVGYYDYFELMAANANYNFSNEPVKGILESRSPNKELGWETVTLTDIGFDVDLFDNKLSITADYYVKNTKDILLNYNVAAETGIWIRPALNLAKVRNKGFELAVTHRNKIGDVSYTIGANLATNNNEIIDLSGSNNMIQNGGDNIRYILREGESIGSFYGYRTDGLYTQKEIDEGRYYILGRKPKAGDIKYVSTRDDIKYYCDLERDSEGKIIKETDAHINADDRAIIGKDVPDFTYGLNLSVNYKNFELSVFGQGVSGTKAAFESEQVYAFMLNSNPRKYHMKRWTEENPNPRAVCPRLYGGTYWDEYNKHFSSYELFDADYFRIKTISLGYMVPDAVVKNWGISSLKLFLTAENFFTIRADKAMEDFDPESSSGRGLGALGQKSVAFGVNLSF